MNFTTMRCSAVTSPPSMVRLERLTRARSSHHELQEEGGEGLGERWDSVMMRRIALEKPRSR